MKRKAKGKIHYCLGVDHPDLLPKTRCIDLHQESFFCLRGYSIGGHGGVTTNKILATLCAELFNCYVQAYPKYGSEKKGLPTTFFLALSDHPIMTHQELHRVNCVVINNPAIMHQTNPVSGAMEGASVFLKTIHQDPIAIWNELPRGIQAIIQRKNIRLFALNTKKIVEESTHDPELVIIMQGILFLGAFLKMTPLLKKYDIAVADCFATFERVLHRYFVRQSEQVIKANLECIKRGFHEVIEVPVQYILSAGTI